MKMIIISLCVLSINIVPTVFGDALGLVTEKDKAEFDRIYRLVWESPLRQVKLQDLETGLNSENYLILSLTFQAAAIHGIVEAFDFYLSAHDWRPGEILCKALKEKTPVIGKEDVGLEISSITYGGTSTAARLLLEGKVLDTHVMALCRRLRAGDLSLAEVKIKSEPLSRLHTLLLKHSTMNTDKAVQSLVSDLANVSHLKMSGDLYQVLRTYGPESRISAIAYFKDTVLVNNSTEHGLASLLNFLISVRDDWTLVEARQIGRTLVSPVMKEQALRFSWLPQRIWLCEQFLKEHGIVFENGGMRVLNEGNDVR